MTSTEQSKGDREASLLNAMGEVIKILEPFKYAERRRLLRAVIGFYEQTDDLLEEKQTSSVPKDIVRG